MLSKPNRDLVGRVCGPIVVRHEGSFRPHIDTLDRLLDAARSEPDERVKGLVEALQQISLMKTFPDDKTNTFTLVMAHRIADEALSTYQDATS